MRVRSAELATTPPDPDSKTWRRRYSVLAILCCSYALCYVDRMAMASAVPFVRADFHLSATSAGAVLSAFFLGYTLMQIPGGLLVDRFGPRAVLTIAVTWWSLMTAATGFARGLVSMLATRFMFGIGEGPYQVSASKALTLWFPRSELGRANGLHLAATSIGATVAPLFVAAMLPHWGWRSAFYLLCLPGGAAAIAIWLFVRNSPVDAAQPASAAAPASTDLWQSFRTPAVLWCAATLFFINLVGWGLLNWLPTYLLEGRGFDVREMGIFAALTNLSGAVGYPLGGYLCDRFFSQKLYVPIVLGTVLCAGFTYLAAIAPTGQWAVASLSLVFLLSNAASTAVFTLPLVVVSKQAVGSAAGIVNTAGQLAGVVSPLLVGVVLDATHGNFQVMLYWLVAFTLLAIVPALRIRQAAAPQPA